MIEKQCVLDVTKRQHYRYDWVLVALEILAWLLPGLIFVSIYIHDYTANLHLWLPHGLFMTQCYTLGLLIRAITSRTIKSMRISHAVQSIGLSALWLTMIFYYMLSLIGLYFWGGLISWRMVVNYSHQVTSFEGFSWASFPALCGVAALVVTLWATVVYQCLRRVDWVGTTIACSCSPRQLLLLLTACVALLFQQSWIPVYDVITAANDSNAKGYRDLEGHLINNVVATRLDAMADRARQSYVPASTSVDQHANLVVIVVDALRDDHLGVYGYGRQTTPHLAAILDAQPHIVVRDVHSVCADTAGGLLSLFSSQYPAEFSYHPFVLQQALAANGYDTRAILSSDQTSFYDMRSYYGAMTSFVDGLTANDGYTMNDDHMVLDEVGRLPVKKSQPLFLQLHLMAAHILRKKEQDADDWLPALNYSVPANRTPLRSDEDINFNDNGVKHADREIAELLTVLRAKHYLDRALVVITADHGDALGEHGLYTHANSVHEQVLRIPLILIGYGLRPQPLTNTTFPSQPDIAPTLLSELGLPIPALWAGHDLIQDTAPYTSYFEEHDDAGLLDRSNAQHVWKYWRNSQDQQEYVFDVLHDEPEANNLLKQVPVAQLVAWRALLAKENLAGARYPH